MRPGLIEKQLNLIPPLVPSCHKRIDTIKKYTGNNGPPEWGAGIVQGDVTD